MKFSTKVGRAAKGRGESDFVLNSVGNFVGE
jgi:hypothetical protein